MYKHQINFSIINLQYCIMVNLFQTDIFKTILTCFQNKKVDFWCLFFYKELSDQGWASGVIYLFWSFEPWRFLRGSLIFHQYFYEIFKFSMWRNTSYFRQLIPLQTVFTCLKILTERLIKPYAWVLGVFYCNFCKWFEPGRFINSSWL